jgi:hypothetical protein
MIETLNIFIKNILAISEARIKLSRLSGTGK